MTELVSIVMPNYNCAKYIPETIKSVLAQTYINWELLFVDDCSTDNSVELVKKFNDSRIKIFINEKNSGAAVSRNLALREAKGKYIAFLDSDDLWMPAKLEKQIAYMKEKGYAFTYSDYIISMNKEKLPYVYIAPKKVTRRKLFNYCYFSTITVVYDREKVGLVQIEDLKKNNDYAMWFEALKKVDAYRFAECLAVYCKHDNSISSGSKWKLLKHHYILYRKGLHKSKFMSVILTVNNVIFGVFKKLFYKKKVV